MVIGRVVAHTFDSRRQRQEDLCELKANLVYLSSSRRQGCIVRLPKKQERMVTWGRTGRGEQLEAANNYDPL